MSEALKYKQVFGKILESKLPFVLYKKPEEEEVYGLIQKDVNMWFVQDFESDKGFVFSPFDSSEERVLIKSDARLTFEMEEVEEVSDYKGLKLNNLFEANVAGPDMELEKSKYLDLIGNAVVKIKEGKIDKVVLSREELWSAKKVDFASIFKDLVSAYDDAFVYIWFHPLVGMWIGATPELFLERDDIYVHTTALAGTRVYEDKIKQWGKKELKEQKFVSDFIEKVFNQNMLNSVKTFGPDTVSAGNLEHLRSDITGELSEISDLNHLINSLHPTPAVCGSPLDLSKKYIEENEKHNRNFYTGFLGELNIDDHSELYVNLRCLQVVREGVKFFVGGGVTEESNPEMEWEETVNKSNTLKNIVLKHLS